MENTLIRECEEKIIEVNDVSMCFNLSEEKIDSLKEYFIKFAKGSLKIQKFWALKNISLSVKKGESIGIIGLNGSGKSTLLKLIAGVLKPTNGEIIVRGNMSPLIELGAGFDMDLTARENIYLNGAVLGYTKKFMQEKFDEIIDFSELSEFVNVPIKNYSSGMIARLAFAIATIVRPEILIVDEILSVGDYLFQKKCEERMEEMMGKGTTVIFVSHSIDQVMKICQRAVWLEKGNLKMIGEVNEVCKKYMN